MRLLILAAAATLALGATAMADESMQTSVKGAKHHHYREANASVAPVAEGSAPADSLNAHDARVRNLRDSGYNPTSDHDAAGNIRQY